MTTPESPAEGSSAKSEEDLQARLAALFNLVALGRMKFTQDVPQTVAQIEAVRRNPDGRFDLSTVGPLVRAACCTLDAHPLVQELTEGTAMELPPIELPDVHRERQSEADFTQDLITASNTVRTYLLLTAGAIPLRPLERFVRGIVVGSMVRLYKLHDTVIYLIVADRLEMATIIFRSLIDTAVNLRCMLTSPDREADAEAMVRASLAYEKKLWDEIEKRKQDPPLPIEERMIASIKRVFSDVGVDPATVKWSNRHWGGGMYKKAEATGLLHAYEFAFRTASHAVHGTWSDLASEHLALEGGRYMPELRYSGARPEIIEAASKVCLVSARDYAEQVLGYAAKPLDEALGKLEDWYMRMSARHEEWKQAQGSEEGS